MAKDTIFISHSSHQDDYAAAWLASKLKVIGYKVWLDMDDLSAGDSFNSMIGPVIREQSKVFIALTTRSYSEKSKDQNSGVSRELNCAVTITKDELGHNFIFPVRFDEIPYEDFPYHYTGWNGVNFEPNWKQGLIDLVKELEKIDVPKIENPEDPKAVWFKVIRAEKTTIVRDEQYFSNWFGFELPSYVVVHYPTRFVESELYEIPYPLILEADRIVTFMTKQTVERFVLVHTSQPIAVDSFVTNDPLTLDDGFKLNDPRKKLIRLLNKAFQAHLENKALICWKRGKASKVFYFRHNEFTKMISLKRFGKPNGRRALTGQVSEELYGVKHEVNWAFNLAANADIDPVPHFRITYGLTFSDKDFKRFGKKSHHKLRRSIPADWFNRKWFETLLAAVLRISQTPESEFIEIPIDENSTLKIYNEPYHGTSPVGYNEP